MRKRREAREEEEKERQDAIESVPSLEKEVEELRLILIAKEREVEAHQESSAILKVLHNKGFIDDNGDPI